MNQTTNNVEKGEYLYLHDMAVSPTARKSGVATRLFEELMTTCKAKSYEQIMLVAVHGVEGYWQRFGFIRNSAVVLDHTYEDNAQPMMLMI